MVKGQNDRYPWEKYYNQLCDIEDIENYNQETTYDILCNLSENKINLNNATKEDLEQIIFLTQPQIEEICEYVYKYGPIRSLGELAMIETLDRPRRNLLEYFVCIDNDADKKHFPKLNNILKYGKNEIIATAKIPLYERKGDRNGYLGYKYKHWIKYSFKYGQYVKAGITAAQDAGEPFFANKNKYGYDYYSFYVQLRKLGKFKNISLGRYRAKLGMGLIMNNDLTFGKIASITSPNINNTIRAHSSVSEANYMQGAAATYNITKGLDITALISYRKIDTTPGDEPNTIQTILRTGYHRTESEMDRKHNASQTTVGGNINYFNNGFHVGMSSVYTMLDKTLTPDVSKKFRQYYLNGKDFVNVSTDYGYINHKIAINGETAIDKKGTLATINRITYQAGNSLSLTALQRFYSYKFQTFFGECFNDGGRVQNESGMYLGINWTAAPGLSIMAYSDYAYYAWPKYRISSASHSFDNFISATYIADKFTFGARYRLRLKQRDNDDKTGLTDITEQRARITAGYANGKWQFNIQGDINSNMSNENSIGWMISQNTNYKNRWLNASIGLSYFNTDDYDSRIYTYEKGLLYNFSFPSFFGHGIRYYTHIRTDFSPKLMLIFKLSTTDYFDRNKISSSYQQIDHSSMTDIEAQVRWKF
ncbi:MAG: helix-hairpin-helix domain-containing protein [Prevotella sp.]